MTGYGQFCSMARAHEVLGGRWTLLVVREILCGSRRFNDIHRGIPRMSQIGLVIDGPKVFTRAFPKWFDLYPFAHIGPAGRKTNNGPACALTAMYTS
jgi:hypothetical protein